MYDNNIYNMNYVNEIGINPITVCANIKKAQMQVSNSEGEKILHKKFRPFSMYGLENFMFHRYAKHDVIDTIYDYYTYEHLEIEESRAYRKQLIKRIKQNIDPAVYKTLFEYDKASFYKTSKHLAYVEAMLLDVKRKHKESKREYKLREASIRKKLLKDAGINLEYHLSIPPLFDGNSIIDYFKATKNAIKFHRFSNVHFRNIPKNKDKDKDKNKDNDKNDNGNKEIEKSKDIELESNQNNEIKITQEMKTIKAIKTTNLLKDINKQLDSTKTNIVNCAKRAKKEVQKKYTAKKGLLNELRQKIQHPDFKQKVQKTLKKGALKGVFAAGVIALAVGGLNLSKNQSIQPVNGSNNAIESETNNMQNNLKELSSASSSMTIQENTQEDSTELSAPIVRIKKKENKERKVKTEKKDIITLQDALMESLEIDFDSNFTKAHGKYYETPEETGRFGNFENRKGDLKISLVNVIDENGAYHEYSINDGKTLYEIKAMYPNSTISYHVNTSSGMMLGWNANAKNIENKLVKRSLKDMKDGGYLSTEIMQFLCENKLSDSIDKNECSELLTSINSAMKQYKADKADKAMEMSNIDNER